MRTKISIVFETVKMSPIEELDEKTGKTTDGSKKLEQNIHALVRSLFDDEQIRELITELVMTDKTTKVEGYDGFDDYGKVNIEVKVDK